MGTNYIAPIWRMPRNANNTPVDKLSNYSINLGGTNEYIDCGNSSNLDITGALTISFWIYGKSNASLTGIISKAPNTTSIVTNAQYHIEVNGSSNGLRFVVTGVDLRAGTETTGTAPTLTVDQWQHFVMTWNGTNEMIVYKNGVEVATKNQANTIASNTNSVFLGRRNGYGYLEGQLSQACIFNYALDSTQVTYLHNLNNPMAITGGEPVGYWPLGDNSNPNSNAGYPNISVGADSVFDFATGDALRITKNSLVPERFQNIGNENSYSISFWVKSTYTGTGASAWYSYHTFTEIRTATSSNTHIPFSIGLRSGQIWFGRTPNQAVSDQAFQSTGTINDGNWHHIVCTVNDRILKYYIDGDLDSTKTFTAAIGDCSVGDGTKFTGSDIQNFQIGARTTNGGGLDSYANGDELTNFQFWDTELIDTEVNELYNNGQPLMTGTQPKESNLIGWYKMNQSANWEADTVGNWQIPDNRSAYPQSFTFLTTATNSTTVNSPVYYNFPGDFTVSVWAKVHNIGATYGMIFAIGNNSLPPTGPGAYFGFAASNRRLLYDDVSSGAYFTSNNVWEYNEWCHIVVVKEGTVPPRSNNLQIYINGQPDSIVATSTTGVQGQLTLGRWLGGTNYRLDGNISNFQFWDKALSAPQVLTLYNDGTPLTSAIETANLQGWWKLDNTAIWDGNEWDFPDLSGNAVTLRSNDMTEQNLANDNVSELNAQSQSMDTTNLVTSNINRTQPYSNYSFNFDRGQADFFDLGTNSSMDVFGSNFSCSVWFNHTDASGNANAILEFGTFAQKFGMQLGLSSNTGVSFSFGPNLSQPLLYNGGSGYNDGNWHNFIVTYDGSSLKGYVDGVELTFISGSITLGGFNTIGKGRNTPTYFNGKLSNCCLFDRDLTEQEILKIYNNGVTQDLQATSSFSNNIAAWWPMDEHSSYYDGTDWIIRDLENGNDGDGNNTGNVDDLVGNAPGSEASGVGSNLAIADLKGNMYNSDKNAYSINMGDYADSVTNPASSGRSTEIPTV